ncbi:MAG: glycosyltransferase family 4 protein [Chloroflexi bacterium]|nr:glycosyltransferase family 4 protein [Chloroflexota bacterium]
MKRAKILLVLTYYSPHVSGLTIYVQRLAKALAQRGYGVTVLTSHYQNNLPVREWLDGVEIVRVPVLFRLSKGVVMPTFPASVWSHVSATDIVSIHLPQMEGSIPALFGKLAGKRVVLTYHCDLQLPPGKLNRLVERVATTGNLAAAQMADAIVTYTRDYAENSGYLSRFRHKTHTIYPPIEVACSTPEQTLEFRQKTGLDGKRVVGFAARLATEKGAEYLLEAMPLVRERLPNTTAVFAGEYQNVLGENVFARLDHLIRKQSDALQFLGVLPPQEMGKFFSVCDVLTVPSINSTESFGLVQVEAMLCGTPVIASNLPGVREPIRITGMGEIVPPRDSASLAREIVKVLENRERYVRPHEEIAKLFDIETTVREYERLFGVR